MSERGRIALIFGAVAVAAAGGGFYFVRVYRPAQIREDARSQIAGWEVRWRAARECLLGPSPGSTKTSEALAIREMTPDPWDRGRCTPLVSKLSRGEAPDTGLENVEAAWAEIDHAAGKAATAFASHVASSTTRLDDPLPAALDALDVARDKLRAAAELPPEQKVGAPLTAAEILPIADDGAPLEELHVEALPSAHGFELFGNTASRLVQINLIAGGKPQVGRIGPGSLRAIPDATWGARPGTGEVQVGAYDVEGAMAQSDSGSGAARLKLDGDVAISAVTGTLGDGEIVYGTAGAHGGYGQLVVAHAHEAAITAEAPERIIDARSASDGDGRAVVVWTDTNKVQHARILHPKGDEPVAQLPQPTAGPMCLTADRAWMFALPADPRAELAKPQLLSVGNGKASSPAASTGDLIGCTPEAALLRDGNAPQEFSICSDTCRETTMPAGAPNLATVTVVGGKLVAMVAHAGVLAVWREGGGKPQFYAVPRQVRPVLAHEWPAMALTDGKVIDLLARGERGFVIVRIPAAT
jgi:hypothetical protein